MTSVAVGLSISLALCIASAGCVTSSRGPDAIYQRAEVEYSTRERPGTIVVDPESHFLYLVEGGGRAIRYGVGVGAEGYRWSGTAIVQEKEPGPTGIRPKSIWLHIRRSSRP